MSGRVLHTWITLLLILALLIVPYAPANAQSDSLIRPAECSLAKPQLQIDISRRPGAMCFSIAGPGHISIDIPGAYGVFNRTDLEVKVAFRLDQGAVYWQETVPAGAVRTVDVDRRRSRVIELSVGASGQPVPASIADGNLMSFWSNGHVLGFSPGSDQPELLSVDFSSDFEDRLDSTFYSRSTGDGCFRFESAFYPGVFLAVGQYNILERNSQARIERSTWCSTEVAGGTRLGTRIDGRTMWISRGLFGSLTLSSSQASAIVWHSTEGLGNPR